MAEAHHHEHEEGVLDALKSSQLLIAALLTIGILLAELMGGWWTGSLALLSDAGHSFSDVASLLLSYFAVRLALCEPTETHTFGLHRTEVFAALVNSLALLAISVGIFWEAYQRFHSPPEIKTGVMALVALFALGINLIVTFSLHRHAHGDLNLRSAYLHVLGDVLGLVAVLLAAGIMHFTHWYLADPILSVAIGCLILVSAYRVGRESLHILMEGVPAGLSLGEIAAALEEVPGVVSVHHLHAWSICSNILAVSVHVVGDYTSEKERMELKGRVEALLLERFDFSQSTIETECGQVCPVDESGLVHAFFHEDEV